MRLAHPRRYNRRMDYSHVLGRLFGELTAVSHARTGDRMLCRCSCGTEKVARLSHLKSGSVKSCGCLLIRRPKEIHGKHLMGRSREYKTWNSMVLRCTRTTHAAFSDYGGRGISVCERWSGPNGFQNFFADMGRKPTGLTIERRNNDEGYTPANCYWATQREQSNNKRTNVLFTSNGRTSTLAQWASLVGISDNTMRERLKRGWTIDQAIHSPLRQRLSVNF